MKKVSSAELLARARAKFRTICKHEYKYRIKWNSGNPVRVCDACDTIITTETKLEEQDK